MADAQTKRQDDELVAKVVQQIKRAERNHSSRCDQYASRYRAWVGVLEREQDIWESQLAPKYAFQKIDTLLANLTDRAPKGLVRPCRPGEERAAKAMQKAINEYRRRDGWERTQYEHVQQALVMGLSPLKTIFRYERGLERWREEEGEGDSRRLVEKQREVTRWEQPSTTTIPVEDFTWDPGATRFEDCAWAAARYWVTPAHLKNMEEQGLYQNTSAAAQTRSGRKQSANDGGLMKVDRSDRIAIWEYWERDRIITVANNTILLRHERNPYWHGELPFHVSTTLPDLYRVEGFSEIELIAELQAALWEFLNQRIDNTRFITNAVTIVTEGTQISDGGMFPGGVVVTDDPSRSVVPWTPNISIIEPALAAERDLKADMDDITGVTPYVSGAGSQTLDPQTATQISTFQSMASRRIEKKRNLLYMGYQEKGMQEIALIQQFMQTPLAIRGAENGGEYEFEHVDPAEIVNALLEYEIEDSTEALDRQVRRAESMQLVQLGMTIGPMLQQEGKMLLGSKLFEDVLTSFDKEPDQYFKDLPPAPPVDPMSAGGVLAGLAAGGGPTPPPPASGNGAGALPLPPPPPGAMSG